MRKLITQTEFNKLTNLTISKYSEDTIAKYQKIFADVIAVYPATLMFEVDADTDSTVFEYCEIHLQHPTLTMVLKFGEYTKKYDFHCRDINTLRNVTTYTKSDVMDKFERPQNMGVPSAKKITNWIKYWEDVYNALLAKDRENSDFKAEFLKSLEGQDVKWWAENKRGTIYKNGLAFEFTIHETGVDKQIKLDYSGSASLETFLSLADNQYKGK